MYSYYFYIPLFVVGGDLSILIVNVGVNEIVNHTLNFVVNID